MTHIARRLIFVATFIMLLNITPSWGQPVCAAPGCNSTASDANNNTAGGSDALAKVDQTASGGFRNTAFGFNALSSNTFGGFNTAIGDFALLSNVGGFDNTAIGQSALL